MVMMHHVFRKVSTTTSTTTLRTRILLNHSRTVTYVKENVGKPIASNILSMATDTGYSIRKQQRHQQTSHQHQHQQNILLFPSSTPPSQSLLLDSLRDHNQHYWNRERQNLNDDNKQQQQHQNQQQQQQSSGIRFFNKTQTVISLGDNTNENDCFVGDGSSVFGVKVVPLSHNDDDDDDDDDVNKQQQMKQNQIQNYPIRAATLSVGGIVSSTRGFGFGSIGTSTYKHIQPFYNQSRREYHTTPLNDRAAAIILTLATISVGAYGVSSAVGAWNEYKASIPPPSSSQPPRSSSSDEEQNSTTLNNKSNSRSAHDSRSSSSSSSSASGGRTGVNDSSETKRENIFKKWFGMDVGAKYYEGGFEDVMTKQEAALILGVRESSTPARIKDAHRRLLVLNHPDTGGSTYIAGKINEAKELLLKGRLGGSKASSS